MKRMSLQWRLTCITTLCIAIICGCLTMFVYKNGVHYIDSLQDAVESQGDEKGNKSDEIYISIPDDKWDEFADEFSVQVYNNKADYKRNSLIITVLLALFGGVVTYFISGHALRPIREFSDKIEEVQAQNLSDSRIEENNVKELNQLGISYNKMLERLSEAFEIQRQFTANAAHELRTPLALMQVQLDLYNSASHPGNDADTLQTIKMVTEQNDKLNRMVKTLLDMSELQTCFEVVNMGKLCDFRNGINYSKDETGNDYQIVNVRNISSSRILLDGEDFDVITVPTSKAENYVLKPDDIIIARSGCPGSTRLLLSSANTLFCGFIICCSPNDSSMRNYLVYCLKQLEGTNATTSGGSILQNVSQDTLKGLHVIVPEKQIIDKFNKTIGLIFARMLNCLKESKALTKQRDELLPLLMNGQASVNSD